MELDADPFHTNAPLLKALDEPFVQVGGDVRLAGAVVDQQPGLLGEEAASLFKAPGQVVVGHPVPLLGTGQARNLLVDHVPDGNVVAVALGDLGHMPGGKGLQPGRVLRIDPVGHELGLDVHQGVAFGGDAVGLAPLDELIGRRAAPHGFRAFGKARLAVRRLQLAPIEGDGGEVEQPCEGLLVLAVQLGRGQLAEHEQVAAEEVLVGPLPDRKRRVLQGLAVGPHDTDHGVALAVALDVGVDLRGGRLPGRLVGFGHLCGRNGRQHYQ